MTKSPRTPLSIDDERKAAYEAEAQRAGMSLAEWLCWCADANLPKSAQKKLSPRKQRGRPKKGDA